MFALNQGLPVALSGGTAGMQIYPRQRKSSLFLKERKGKGFTNFRSSQAKPESACRFS